MWIIEELFMEKDNCDGCEIKVAGALQAHGESIA